jgi:predicted transcriptional regulator of viral defense system
MKYTMTTKSIGSAYRHKLAQVIRAAKGIITPQVVSETLSISTQEAGRILSRWNQHGWVKRIKRGVYIPISVDDITGDSSIEDPWILANRLYYPGYIGGFSAIKHWDFSEQLFETTTFFTSKKIKIKYPEIGNSHFQLKNISAYKIFATQAVWRDNVKILISDPSKTIVDLFDDPTIVGGMRVVQDVFLEYKESEYFDVEKIINYAEKMKNRTIFKRFGFLMETMGLNDLNEKYDLHHKISMGNSIFDPGIENTSIVRKWNLRIPAVWKTKNDREK